MNKHYYVEVKLKDGSIERTLVSFVSGTVTVGDALVKFWENFTHLRTNVESVSVASIDNVIQ